MWAAEHQREQLRRYMGTLSERVAAFLGQQFDAVAAQTLAGLRGYSGAPPWSRRSRGSPH